MSTYLVVANETASGAELREYLLRRACRDRNERFVLLMPATPVQDLLAWEAGESIDIARDRAIDVYHALRDEGLPIIEARIGDRSPLDAITAELHAHPDSYAGLIISTHPAAVSRWLKMDLVHQAERRFHLPVFHVQAIPLEPLTAPLCLHIHVEPVWDTDEGALVYQCNDCHGIVENDARPPALQAWRP